MRRRLKLAILTTATTAIATLLSVTPCVQAATNAPITPTTDDSGHKIYTNDVESAPKQKFRSQPGTGSQPSNLVFWSTTERRWKSVPHANVQAAKSAAAEVNEYLGKPTADQAASASSACSSALTQMEVDAAIDKAAARHNVDPNLVRALVKVESNFNPNAVSRKGAMGLMQLMPSTARQLKVTNPFDPEENVDAGVRHLKKLLESYNGNVPLSLAAYNAGSGAVARSAGIPRYRETRNYVRRITTLYGGNLGSTYFDGASSEPVKVQRDARGVLYITNTD
jgi:soluble lytic murein transglycosylase-like protein